MIKILKQILSGGVDSYEIEKPVIDHKKKIQIASCALLLEIANADDDFSDEERAKIVEIMRVTFSIAPDYVDELIELAEKRIYDSVSIYEFTDLINQNFSKLEKFQMLINLWRIIFIDKQLEPHEDHLAKRIGNNLKFDHREIIEAKLIAKEELK